ncbi:hypothetical protein, partial [Salmonella sp. s58078]|uniref:hypothetical protein n=1 Tax=Salmonella sp. s58078 TaxID=3159699 RepID=UPI00397FB422
MENLNAFCGNSTGLFDPKVIFPALESLNIQSLPNITEIWDKQVLPRNSFPPLADVEVYICEKLVTVFPSILWAQSLRHVRVADCKAVTVVVSITGLEERDCSIF